MTERQQLERSDRLAGCHECADTESPILRAVEDGLTARLDDLNHRWQQLAGSTADVLGADDIPALTRLGVTGGKRVRPRMVHWGWVAAGAPSAVWEQVVTAGIALELLHGFAIIHDDVMDRSAMRRGRPTAQVIAADAYRGHSDQPGAIRFGDSIAILAGDLAHAEADNLIADLGPTVRHTWRTMVIELVLGQRYDLTRAATHRHDLQQALQVAWLKTGAYTIARPLEIGAQLAHADQPTINCLTQYGAHIGRAYGLRDDLLGTWGDPSQTGKPAGDDLVDGKETVLLALAAERLPQSGQELLDQARGGQLDQAGRTQLQQQLADCGVRRDVETMIDTEVTDACRALDPQLLSTAGIRGLELLAHRLTRRQA